MKRILFCFIVGFLSVLVFHQGLLSVFHSLKLFPFPAYNFSPTEPLGVPAVLSSAFFGGLWGILLGWLVRNKSGPVFFIMCIVLGSVLPTTVAMLVVFPLKGVAVKTFMVFIGLALNAAWGLGMALGLHFLKKLS
jgi:hypothetical protein